MNSPTWLALYESFAARRFGGNLAGVVVADRDLAVDEMQGIASDLLAPTTGFVNRNMTAPSASVRFFTPTQEIDACGHVTIAVASALIHLGLWPSEGIGRVSCAGGEIEIRCDSDSFTMTQQLRYDAVPISTAADLAETLGQPVHRVAILGTGLRHLFVEVSDVARLSDVHLDHAALASLGHLNGVDTIGVYCVLDNNRVRLRDLTAPIGVIEESASGTTSGALGLLLGNGPLIVEQGFEMGRPSILHVAPARPTVAVTGSVRRVFCGELD